MPETPDERSALPIEHAALLWCMRVWVLGQHRAIDATARIERMATQLDTSDAAPFIEGFMFAIQHGAARPLSIACVCCPRISADERTLLDAMGLAQERRTFEALLALRGLLTSEGARAALTSAEGLGTALARVGRFLPAPDTSVGQFAFSAWPSA